MGELTRKFPHRRRRGLGLVEMLVALVICAGLLVALAAAFDASFKAYAVNDTQAQLAQRARIALNRMVAYVRSTSQHLPDDDAAQAKFQSGFTTSASAIRMMIDSSNGVIFRQVNNTLVAVPFTISGTSRVEGTARVLLNGVGPGDFIVTCEPQKSAAATKAGGAFDQLKRASIALTVRASQNTAVTGEEKSNDSITLSASVVPRRNVW